MPRMAYVIYMDTAKQQLVEQTFTIRSIGEKPKTVRAKSIWAAFESACLTGDILVFESIAMAKKEGK